MSTPAGRARRAGARLAAALALALTWLPAPGGAQPVADRPFPQQRAVAGTALPAPPAPAASAPAVPTSTLHVAHGPGDRHAVVVGTEVREWRGGTWVRVRLGDDREGWDPAAVPAIAWDGAGRLWVATSQGVAAREADGGWRFVDPARGLPVLGITSMAGIPEGGVWVGTATGAIRLGADGVIEYRQGRRWLPHDEIRAVVVDAAGTAWFETPAGVGGIAAAPATLAQKAAAYDADIDRYHRRTPYGYVVEAHLRTPGDRSTAYTVDNDNDGLWTGMYGAAQAFAWAATRNEAARQRARRAFEALRFLVDVTRGGTPAPDDGFPARSILPTSGPDPNRTTYTPEADRRHRERDAHWKVLTPRWPRSADGQWFWKADTSSDELDGHYFFYALYHDLVARDEAERAEVAAVVRRITDHLLAHDFTLTDHDGTPTRWAQFGPAALNLSPRWVEERGLNSLSMLTYLRVAHHVTGDARYDAAARELVSRHGYAMNLVFPKYTAGVGGGNQSDDEMAFMNYYHLLKYEPDPAVRAVAARSLRDYWRLERPERNPLFAIVAAVSLRGREHTDAFGTESLALSDDEWVPDTIDTLRRFPVDLVDHGLRNSHRLDVQPLPAHVRPEGGRAVGLRARDGKVLPVDERMVFHWNVDPYALDHTGRGARLADGTSYLLPYYMALHHGVIAR
ncbi:hypothetical protein TBR22_A41110 [Luteitalea sp. TBR-22]|uniref:hypothetical protein n=1 Tax=Luteitalea sp. TBR-22 TaxID=2802971 RepID=UPI001AFB5586|nr:hypothetical protein [Luteitalea sp. TBR-22]BCS34885.1 hypothetical protein TBR22_A41110 [Luteitalea sp. TBR-22]